MNRIPLGKDKELIQAMLDGETLEFEWGGEVCWYDPKKSSPWRYKWDDEPERALPVQGWESTGWRIREKPKLRPMTAQEARKFCQNSTRVVMVRDRNAPPQYGWRPFWMCILDNPEGWVWRYDDEPETVNKWFEVIEP